MQTCIRSILNKISGFHHVSDRLGLVLASTFHTSGRALKGKKSPDKEKRSPAKDTNNNVGNDTGEDVDKTMVIKVLNVAEKNDAAKNISALLSNGNARRVNISRQ